MRQEQDIVSGEICWSRHLGIAGSAHHIAAMTHFWTIEDLVSDLAALGLGKGDIVLGHAGLRSIGPMIAGPDTLIAALRQAVGAGGTIMAYADWQGAPEDACDEQGHILPEWRDHVLPFDSAASRAIRDNGAFPEFLRTTPGTLRSLSPGPSMVALGAKAQWLIDPHPLDYGYGPGTPLARLVEAGGKVVMIARRGRR